MRKRRPDSASKKKNQRGPGAAPPQHEQFFDSQPRGVFVFLPISDRAPRVDLCASGGPIPHHQKKEPARARCRGAAAREIL